MHSSAHRILIAIIVAAILVAGIVAMFMQRGATDVGSVDDLDPPAVTTLVGTATCLPHRDTSGPVTMECAFGLRTDDGEHVAVDLSMLGEDGMFDFQTGERFELTGTLVPLAAISSNAWAKYDIVGIMRVDSLMEI